VIAVSACLGLSIRQAAASAKASALEGISITATISCDRAGQMGRIGSSGGDVFGGFGGFDRSQFSDIMGSASSLTVDEYKKYAAAESVSDFYYTVTAYCNGSDGLSPVSDEDTDGDDGAESSENGEDTESYGVTPVLQNVSYDFEKGKMYCIIGKSGAGKTTLLSLLSGLTDPRRGEIFYEDKNIASIDKYVYRSKYIGVVFQSYNLLTKYTALENVVLSMDIAGYKTEDKNKRALELLESVGLDEDEANRRILKLSGGQQQRVAIARALSYDPDIILADEPTGNLDADTQNEIMAIFRNMAEQGKCVILVSHSPEVAALCDERYELVKLSGGAKRKADPA
jgi:putative ABC transport system ATP-binding protein